MRMNYYKEVIMEDDGGWGLRLPLEECWPSFNLEKAVCNHGFFMMAPNTWQPSTKTLRRPLRLANCKASVTVSVSHPPDSTSLLIQVHDTHHPISHADEKAILDQVRRMLRISEKDERNVKEFQQMHSEGKEMGFGRLFRSPSLFEDAVKSILLCNCNWERALDMAKALCELQPQLCNGPSSQNPEKESEKITSSKRRKGVKRKQAGDTPAKYSKCTKYGAKSSLKALSGGNFPTSSELAFVPEDILKEQCNLGYRAKTIVNLAKMVECRQIKLEKLEEALDTKAYMEASQKLKKIKGFGPFVCANILMCIGFYEDVPSDSETIRHIREVHAIKSCSKATITKNVKEIYDKYAPFQCLAYWLELLRYYENRFGKLSELPASDYHTITGKFSNISELNELSKNSCNSLMQ